LLETGEERRGSLLILVKFDPCPVPRKTSIRNQLRPKCFSSTALTTPGRSSGYPGRLGGWGAPVVPATPWVSPADRKRAPSPSQGVCEHSRIRANTAPTGRSAFGTRPAAILELGGRQHGARPGRQWAERPARRTRPHRLAGGARRGRQARRLCNARGAWRRQRRARQQLAKAGKH
jgi:hypothetical protein